LWRFEKAFKLKGAKTQMNHTEHGTIAVGALESAMHRIMTPPEPAEPHTKYNVHTSTPWGAAQAATYFGTGIVMYSTAGHGGFHVAAGLLKSMPDYLQRADRYADGTAGWFEEDCAWSIVVISFPDRFNAKTRESAISTMQSTYPEAWQRFCESGRQQ
jgi:hypothetical protein